MKANAHLATEQLRFCLHNDPSYAPELLSSSVVTPLAALVKESPGERQGFCRLIVYQVISAVAENALLHTHCILLL